MSELIEVNSKSYCVQRYLLNSVSVMALVGSALLNSASAADRHDPAVWIDFGGQFEQLSNSQEQWSPDFISEGDRSLLAGSFPDAQKPPRIGYDADVGISYHPNEWFVSASLHFGRARHRFGGLEQDKLQPWWSYAVLPTSYREDVYTTENHRVLDFKVGKDVGVGLLGGQSSLSLGVRLARFETRGSVQISSDFVHSADLRGSAVVHATNFINHEFRGAGPSIEWKGMFPIVGEPDVGQFAIDAGVNIAVLFGRQSTSQSTDGYQFQRSKHPVCFPTYSGGTYCYGRYETQTLSANSQRARRRNVTVPNLGGFIGASYRLPNVKLSLGYRADMYFNAMDGGVSSFKSEERGFFGPYFNLSVGLGG